MPPVQDLYSAAPSDTRVFLVEVFTSA